jgi:hypothetical protein
VKVTPLLYPHLPLSSAKFPLSAMTCEQCWYKWHRETCTRQASAPAKAERPFPGNTVMKCWKVPLPAHRTFNFS